jgi:hypothetical protein
LTAAVIAQTRVKATSAPVPGPTGIKVDGKIIKSYIEYIAAPQNEGRKSLTAGYEKTAEWAAAKFKEWGLKPAGDNETFLQNVSITGPRSAFAWTSGIPELTVDGRTFFLKDNDFTLDAASTPGTEASAQVVFAGYGISAPAKGLDEYAGLDVKDKIVLVFNGSPKDAPAARGMFGASAPEPKDIEAWSDESKDQAKIKTAYEKGAAAIILFSPDKLALPGMFGAPQQQQTTPARTFGMRPKPVEGSPYARPFLVVTDTNERVFRQIMWRDPQESARGFVARINQIQRDVRDKKARSQATGVSAQIKGYTGTQFYGEKFKNNISHNVIGKVDGTDPALSTQYVIIGGHLDHIGATDGVIYNGADDDASGAALTMEMARLIAANAASIRPRRTLVFALWCGEEMGLLGSNYFAKSPTVGLKMDSVVAYFNNDMVGLGERIGAPGALNFPTIFDVIMRDQAPDVAKVVDASTGGPGGSDHSAFIEQGIEALALMTSGGVGHPDYHDAGDKADKIDPEILRKTGQFVLQGSINLANETGTELLIPDRVHLYNGMRLTMLNLDEARAGRGPRFMFSQQSDPQGPRFNVSLSDTTAFGGNVNLIDMAAKLLSIGRVVVPTQGDGQWFGSSGLTERGRTALKAFESNGVVLHLMDPSAKLLSDMLDAAAKPFIVSGMPKALDAALAKRINDKNVLIGIDWDPAAPEAIAARLIELKKVLGDSDNLLLLTHQLPPSRMAEFMPEENARRKPDEAKQKMYLALIKAGWNKDEIYAMVGTEPRRSEPMEMPPPGAGRLGGNLAKLSPPPPAPDRPADNR